MVFKLVRTDTSEPRKIELPLGTHLIGRGQFLDCSDKRVSRKHGELEVTNDSVSIKSLHSNPCFYLRRSTDKSQTLKQECTIYLSHGDKFGLLPCTYWYELLHCTSELQDSPSIIDNVNKDDLENADYNNSNTEEQIGNTSDGSVEDTQNTPLNSDINETVVNDAATPESPSVLMNSQSNQDSVDKPSSPLPDQNTEAKPNKRSTCESSDSSSPVEVKKVKIEPDESKDVKPGPSNDQAGSSDDKKDDGVPSSTIKPPARERCIYGENCYRRNPQHLAQFSHPQDGDWGSEARGVCPYGRACRRREPRHWLHHSHPDGVLPPDPHGARPGVTNPQRRQSDSEDDKSDSDVNVKDSQKDLIVTGKRVRKTIKRPSYSGSESGNDDPYQTDESDEWRPGSSDLLSTPGFSQDIEE